MTLTTTGQCSKADPRTCRRHGAAYRQEADARAQLFRQVKSGLKQRIDQQRYEEVKAQVRAEKAAEAEAERLAAEQKQAELITARREDFAASWKPKAGKDGSLTVSVYRSGIVEAPKERKVEAASYEKADASLPADHPQGRMTGIFASPSLGGVARWVSGNHFVGMNDVKVREIRVDADEVYVYSVNEWEHASSRDWMNRDADPYSSYWKSGVPLREWMRRAEAEPDKYDPTEWELLLPASQTGNVKPVGAARVAAQVRNKYDNREITEILAGKRRR